MSSREYIAKIHREDDSLWAEVLDLPGCFASGDSLDELREALEEAVRLYLADEPEISAAATRRLPRELEAGEMRLSLPA